MPAVLAVPLPCRGSLEMTRNEIERDVRIAGLLEEAELQLRAGQPLDVTGFQARHPDLADELPALLETLRDLDTAAEHWKSGTTQDEAEAAPGAYPPASKS